MIYWCDTLADTYTTAELVKCSVWCLQDHPGAYQTYVGCRDHAMLLLSTSLVFRGDNTRSALMSDLFSNNVPMNDISLGTCVKVISESYSLCFILLMLFQGTCHFCQQCKAQPNWMDQWIWRLLPLACWAVPDWWARNPVLFDLPHPRDCHAWFHAWFLRPWIWGMGKARVVWASSILCTKSCSSYVIQK